MPPISDEKWRAKGLDERANIEEAMALIQLIIDIFTYWKQSKVQGNMRSTHNKIWTEIDVFRDALNALAASCGEAAPNFNITKLWERIHRVSF